MCRHWRSWVWVCWVGWKRWWRNSSAGGKLQRLTFSCSETSPFRSGFAPRTWSTSIIRKHWKVWTWTLKYTPVRPVWGSLLACNKCKYSWCCVLSFAVRLGLYLMLIYTGYVYLRPLEGTLSYYSSLSLLTLSWGGCSVSQGHCSKRYSLEIF